MGRTPAAPFGYECPYKGHCPHLGMSTLWALEQIKYADQEREYMHMLQQHIEDLERKSHEDHRRIAELEARLRQKHSSAFKPNKRPSKRKTRTEVNNDSVEGQSAPRGAPRGHPPWNRKKPERIDRTVHVPPPSRCPHCNSTDLQPPQGGPSSQLQEDIVLRPRTVVTEFIHTPAYCPNCRRDVCATADDELRNCSIGPVAQSAAVYLRHAVKLSYRDTCTVMETLFGISYVPATALAFDRRTAARGRSLYEDLREKIKAADIVYADETHWRIDGRSAYLWYAGNPDAAFFHVDRSRSSEVAVSILGDDFQGSLCTDAYAAYNAVNSLLRQSCLAHITRKAKDIIAEIMLMPPAMRDANALRFLRSLRKIINRACRIGAKRNSGVLSCKRARAYIPHFYNLLDSTCSRSLSYEPAEKLRLRLIDPKREYDRLFTFLRVPGMEPTNNHAEQTLRLPVIFRKICFGNRSDEGAESLGVILSLLTSARRQNKDPLTFLQRLLTDTSDRNILFEHLPSP